MRAVGYACLAPPAGRSAAIPAELRERLGVALPGADLNAQTTAIAHACVARGWTLTRVFSDPAGVPVGDRPGRAGALHEVDSGRAEVLVVAKLDAMGAWSDLGDLLDRAERERWALAVLDLSLDTLSGYGSRALRAVAREASAHPPAPFPTPPAELMFRVVGSDSPGRFDVGARLAVAELDRLLRAHGPGLADLDEIFDFGSGPGRLLRHLRLAAPGARLAAADQDEESIAWVRRELPFVEAAVASPLPPLPLASGRFDLIVAFSVFTHLDESYQDAWLTELERLTRPGGTVLATLHGLAKWDEIRRGPMTREPQLARHASAFERRGFLHWTGDDWGPFFPSYYHTSFHRQDYVRAHWTHWFDVLDVIEAPTLGPGYDLLSSGHDIAVLRARSPAAGPAPGRRAAGSALTPD
jgi:SAM-dependent methyltransferase